MRVPPGRRRWGRWEDEDEDEEQEVLACATLDFCQCRASSQDSMEKNEGDETHDELSTLSELLVTHIVTGILISEIHNVALVASESGGPTCQKAESGGVVEEEEGAWSNL